jgi:hypothetical protein
VSLRCSVRAIIAQIGDGAAAAASARCLGTRSRYGAGRGQ